MRALYTAGKGRKAKETAATRFFRSKARGISKQQGRSRTAGRNTYLKYLQTVGRVDSVMNATFWSKHGDGTTRSFKKIPK